MVPKMILENYDPDAILANPDAHPIHKMYAEINIGIRDRGERWTKCANCGEPYQLIENHWTNETVCNEDCDYEFRMSFLQ